MHHQFLSRYGSHFYRDTFAEVLGSGVIGTPPIQELSEYPLIQNDYRQEKIIFELFSGALQENPVRAPGAIT